jgi:hypothetical protein
MSSGSFASSFATIPPAPTAIPTAPHGLSTFEKLVFWSIGYGGWMGIGMLPILLMATNSTKARVVLAGLSAPVGALLMTSLFGVMYLVAAFVHCVLSIMVSSVFLHSCCASIALTAVTVSLAMSLFDIVNKNKQEKGAECTEESDTAEESEEGSEGSDNAEESEEGSEGSDNAEEGSENAEESEEGSEGSDNAEESEEGSEGSDNAEESEEGSEGSEESEEGSEESEESEEGSEGSDNAEESEEGSEESEEGSEGSDTSEESEITEERGKPADANTSLLRSAPPLPESDDEESA